MTNFIQRNRNLLFGILTMLISIASLGQETLTLDKDIGYIELKGKHFLIFDDSTHSLLPHEAYKNIENPNIAWPPDAPLYSNHFINHNLWLKTTICNQDASTPIWCMSLNDFHVSEIEVFRIDPEGLVSLGKQGALLPFHLRPLNQRAPTYFIQPDSCATYLIKLYSEVGASYKVSIVRPISGWSHTNTRYIQIGIFYGLLILLIVYNTVLYLFIRQKTYILYVCYVLIFVLRSLVHDGLGHQFLWPNIPEINKIYDLLLLPMAATFVWYADNFLNIKERLPRYRMWLWLSIGIYFVAFIYHWFDFHMSQVNTSFLLFPFLATLVASIKIHNKGFHEVRFFIIGCSLLILGVTIVFLMRAGIYPDDHFGINAMDYGFLCEALFLSLAMGDRLKKTHERVINTQNKLIEQQKINEQTQQRINRELENKVAQRTLELSDKNKKLESLTQQLNESNVTLDRNLWELGREIKNIFRKNILHERIDYITFQESFPDDLSCLRFVRDLKWPEEFNCRKCNNQKWHDGDAPLSRKCSKCNHRESVTANTIFHRLRLPIQKAMYIVYTTMNHDKTIRLEELESEIELSKSAISNFRKKVREKIKGTKREAPSLEEVIL